MLNEMAYKNKSIIFTGVKGSDYKIYKENMKIISHCSSFRKVVVDGKLLQHCNKCIVNESVLVLLTIQIVKSRQEQAFILYLFLLQHWSLVVVSAYALL